MTTSELGSASLRPGAPAQSRSEAPLAAIPRHVVSTSGRTYCMASYIASDAVIEPPGLLMYRWMSFSASSPSRKSSCAVTRLAMSSSITPPTKMVRARSRQGWEPGSPRVLRVGWDEADAAACRLRLIHRKECAELRDGAQRCRVETGGDGAKLASRIDLPGGLGLRPRTETPAKVRVHGRDRDRQRVGDRHEEVTRYVLAAAFDLGEVGGGAPCLARDLAETAPLPFAVTAQDRAQLLTDLFRAYAQSRTHNAQSISLPSAGATQPGRETLGGGYR